MQRTVITITIERDAELEVTFAKLALIRAYRQSMNRPRFLKISTCRLSIEMQSDPVLYLYSTPSQPVTARRSDTSQVSTRSIHLHPKRQSEAPPRSRFLPKTRSLPADHQASLHLSKVSNRFIPGRSWLDEVLPGLSPAMPQSPQT